MRQLLEEKLSGKMQHPLLKIAITALACIVVASSVVLNTKSTMVSASTGKIKLVYFDAKGVVEMTRIMCKIGGLDFEDSRFSIKVKPEGGFETPEFAMAKETGDLMANMNRAPILMVGDLKIGQSKAIERYVAKRCNMMGNGDEEYAVIDCISEHTRDIREKWGKIRSTGGMAPSTLKDEATKKWFDEELKDWLLKLEKSLPDEAKTAGHCVGSTTSYADLNIWYLLHDNFDNEFKASVAECAKDCHTLNKIADKVGEIAALKQWLIDRPKTMF